MRNSSEYRFRACSLRDAARRAADPVGREWLSRIAERYDRLAAALEQRTICAP
jgi:hypothetical protein